MVDYGLTLYADTRVPYLEGDDLIPQLIYLRYLNGSETGSIELSSLGGRKAIVYYDASSNYGMTGKPYKTWKDGTTIHWQASAFTVAGYIYVFAYT